MKVSAIALLLPSIAAATLLQEAPLDELFNKADHVCEGRVGQVSRLGPQQLDLGGKLMPSDWSVQLGSVFCYKGSAHDTATLTFRSVDPMWGAPLPSKSRILFFAKTQPDDGSLVPLDGGSILPFPVGAVGTSHNGSGISQLQEDLVELTVTGGGNDSRSCLESLLRFQRLDAKSLERLRIPRPDWDTDRTLLRLILLAKSDPPRGLADLAQALSDRDPARPFPWMSAVGEILALRTSNRDLEVLEKLSNSKFPGLRCGAMAGIRRIADPATVPFLLGQLDSDDVLVAYRALITLSELTGQGGDFGPNMGQFEENPARYKQLWRNWWAAKRSAR